MKTRTLLFACIGACVSLPALAAPQGFEWFPRAPGPGDQLYLILNDPCHSTSSIAPTLESIVAKVVKPEDWPPILEMNYESEQFFCNLAPASIQALAIPRSHEGDPIAALYSRHTQVTSFDANGVPIELFYNTVEWYEDLPYQFAMPPAVAGTWFAPSHAEQGLLINMTAKRELLVGWTTYGADGKQRWFSGIAPTVSDESTVTVALTDTGDGRFAGQLPNDAPQKDWGTLTIEYVACGEIEVSWNPKTNTGLQPGTATMQQLTQPHDAACDIEAYASALGQPLTIHELEIETAPQPAN